MYNTTCPHLFRKFFINFLTSTLLRTQNMKLLSKVRRRFFQILWPSQKTQTLLAILVFFMLFIKDISWFNSTSNFENVKNVIPLDLFDLWSYLKQKEWKISTLFALFFCFHRFLWRFKVRKYDFVTFIYWLEVTTYLLRDISRTWEVEESTSNFLSKYW